MRLPQTQASSVTLLQHASVFSLHFFFLTVFSILLLIVSALQTSGCRNFLYH